MDTGRYRVNKTKLCREPETYQLGGDVAGIILNYGWSSDTEISLAVAVPGCRNRDLDLTKK